MDNREERQPPPHVINIGPVLLGIVVGMILMGSIITTVEGFRLLFYREQFAVQTRRIHREVTNDEE